MKGNPNLVDISFDTAVQINPPASFRIVAICLGVMCCEEITISTSSSRLSSKNVKIGDSVSINGVCLTVAKVKGTRATFQVIDETMGKTNFIDLKKGDRVNIEQSLKIGDRLEGHFVLGHIDGTGIIKKIERGPQGSKLEMKINNKDLLPFIAKKGSIAIDGVSLTVVKVKNSIVEIALIPHTLENTTLGLKKIDDTVNIEVDILARYLSNIYQYSGNNK